MRRLALVGALALVAATLAAGAVASTPVAETGTVWSGYVAFGTTFTDVTGTWTEPHADCSGLKNRTKTMSAFWVGLDGNTSNTVEQAGTQANCNGSTGSHFAWFEFYPAKFTELDPQTYPVSEGDTITVDVSQSGGTVTITVTSSNSGWPGALNQFVTSSPAGKDQFNSAEWIAESLSTKLTNFGTVAFSGTTATASGHTGGPADAAWMTDKLTMVNHGGQNATPKDCVSDLGGDGKSFSVVWGDVSC
jgi:hypothetical protein